MSDKVIKKIVERHGEDVIVISTKDWTDFLDEVKANPELYALCKKKFNFLTTHVEFETVNMGLPEISLN